MRTGSQVNSVLAKFGSGFAPFAVSRDPRPGSFCLGDRDSREAAKHAKGGSLLSPARPKVVYFADNVGKVLQRLRRNEHSDGEITLIERIPAMGDRSPKSNQKQASQKQSRSNDASSKKQQLITAQQATKAKLAANKKK